MVQKQRKERNTTKHTEQYNSRRTGRGLREEQGKARGKEEKKVGEKGQEIGTTERKE